MKTDILITAVRYYCKDEEERRQVIQHLANDRPQLMLVAQPTKDYGVTICVLEEGEYRGLVSRFDVPLVLAIMNRYGQVLEVEVNNVANGDECFTVCLECDEDIVACDTSCEAAVWNEWQWTACPPMDDSANDSRIQVSMKVLKAELSKTQTVRMRIVETHFKVLCDLARWDVSEETQVQLGEIRRMVGSHPSEEVRALVPDINHFLNGMGSRKRTEEFDEVYFDMLYNSEEAQRMRDLWTTTHVRYVIDISEKDEMIAAQLQQIEECLKTLPKELYYKCDTFGPLMHCLLYNHIPRKKLMMLLSVLMLREWLRNEMEVTISPCDAANEPETTPADASGDELHTILIERLSPLFYNDATAADRFLKAIANMRQADITSHVNRLVQQNVISRSSCHRDLWSVLHTAGIYTRSESNWNKRIGV